MKKTGIYHSYHIEYRKALSRLIHRLSNVVRRPGGSTRVYFFLLPSRLLATLY